jgi:hypothetical protein
MNATKRADDLFSKLIRDRASGCLATGFRFDCSGVLQCAHIVSRSYRATRWSLDPDGAVALCAAHHVWFTHHPLEWVDWLRANFAGYYEEIRDMARFGEPEKAADAVARLKEVMPLDASDR